MNFKNLLLLLIVLLLVGFSACKKEADPCDNVECGVNAISCDNGICICAPGWTGENCDIFNCATSLTACVNGNCLPDGTCDCDEGWIGQKCNLDDPSDVLIACGDSRLCGPHTVYCVLGVCICESGWFGASCENFDCNFANNGCINGNCQPDGTCDCYEGWYGLDCGTTNPSGEPNTCADIDCGPNATNCINGICICADGYSGEYCDTYNPCYQTECSANGGEQIMINDVCNCECFDGYVGESCEVELAKIFLGNFAVEATCNDIEFSYFSSITSFEDSLRLNNFSNFCFFETVEECQAAPPITITALSDTSEIRIFEEIIDNVPNFENGIKISESTFKYIFMGDGEIVNYSPVTIQFRYHILKYKFDDSVFVNPVSSKICTDIFIKQ